MWITEYEVKSLESLETHLFTCEILSCDDCKMEKKPLQDSKNQVKSCHPDAHKSYFPTIYLKKIDREKITEVISKGYFIEDL